MPTPLKTETLEEKAKEVAVRYEMNPAVVETVVRELAEGSRSDGQIRERWGVSYDRLGKIRARMKDQILDIREGLSERSLAIVATAQEALAEKLEKPEVIAEMSPKDLSAIAKQQGDLSLNLANGQSGGTKNEFNIGEIKAVINAGLPALPKLEELK